MIDIARLKKMADRYVFELNESLYNAHENFIDKAWGPKSIRKNYSYLKWKFKSESNDCIPGLLVYKEGLEINGQLGLIPDRVVINNEIIRCQWGCNFKTLQEFEGSGIGALLDIASLGKAEITFGVNPTVQSENIKLKLGFKLLEGPRIMMLPIDFKHVVALKVPSKYNLAISIASKAIRFYYHQRYRKVYKKVDSLCTTKAGGWKDIFEFLTAARSKINLPHVLHDVRFLEWRCNAFDTLRQQAQSVYTMNGGFILFNAANPYLMINEYYFNTEAEAIQLINKCINIAKQAGSRTIRVYANSNEQELLLKSLGFIGLRNKIKIYAYTANKNINFGSAFHFDGYDGESNL